MSRLAALTRLAFVLVALSLGACATIDPNRDNLVAQVRDASTPEDHLRLAARYERDAADARRKVSEHRTMEQAYRGRVGVGRGGPELQSSILRHCANLIGQHERAELDYSGLASLHRRLAEEAKK
jgi:hypothetical protein